MKVDSTIERLNFDNYSNTTVEHLHRYAITCDFISEKKVLDINPQDSLNGTTALHSFSLQNGGNILRVHDVKEAMEGMLAPTFKEEIVANLVIRDIFKISKIGTIAGCYVTSGKISRNSDVRVIRDGIVIHTGALGSLKRFKDDVKEVSKGYECGLNLAKFNDLKEEDIIEAYEMVEVKQKLK